MRNYSIADFGLQIADIKIKRQRVTIEKLADSGIEKFRDKMILKPLNLEPLNVEP